MASYQCLGFMVLLTASLAALAEPADIASKEKYSTEFLAPEGVWAVDLNFTRGSVSHRYDSNGNAQPLGQPYSGIQLDNLAPLLNNQQLTAALGLGLSLGTTDVDLKLETEILEVTYGYGLSDDLSIGGRFLVGESCSKASLNTRGTTVPGGTDLLRAALTASPFSFSDVDSHCTSGVMAPVFGAAWRVHNGNKDSLMFLPGVRLGRLTDLHDPDVLFMPTVDDGSNDLVLRTDYYRDLGHSLDLAVQFEYNIQFKDKQTLRVPSAGLPIGLAASKERLTRDLGDFFIVDVEVGYRFWQDQLRVYGAYYHKNKAKDSYSSSRGVNVTALESGTTFIDHEFRVGLYYDGVPAWRAGKLPLPLRLDMNYWESTGGKNALKYHFAEFHVSFAF